MLTISLLFLLSLCSHPLRPVLSWWVLMTAKTTVVVSSATELVEMVRSEGKTAVVGWDLRLKTVAAYCEVLWTATGKRKRMKELRTAVVKSKMGTAVVIWVRFLFPTRLRFWVWGRWLYWVLGSLCRVTVYGRVLRVTTAVTFVVTVAVASECGRRWWSVEERMEEEKGLFYFIYLLIINSHSKMRPCVAFWCGG